MTNMVFNYSIKEKRSKNQELQVKNEKMINITLIFHLPLFLQPEKSEYIF